jgi:hypothetical protein
MRRLWWRELEMATDAEDESLIMCIDEELEALLDTGLNGGSN